MGGVQITKATFLFPEPARGDPVEPVEGIKMLRGTTAFDFAQAITARFSKVSNHFSRYASKIR